MVKSRSFKADAVIFDHGIGEELLAGFFRHGARAFGRESVKSQFHKLADAHVRNALEAERRERMLNGLALRIENAGLEGDVDFCRQERGVLFSIFTAEARYGSISRLCGFHLLRQPIHNFQLLRQIIMMKDDAMLL